MKKEVLAGLACSLLMATLAMGEIRAYNAAGDEISGPFGTIQDAIDAMFYGGGDNGRITVDTADSPYQGPGNTNIRMWVPMTIVAIDANSRPAEIGDVVIDCENSSRAFLFLEGQNIADANRVNTVLPTPTFDGGGEGVDANDAFIVSGFKVINGYASEDDDPPAFRNRGCGGGMLIDAGYPIIENCMFTECLSDTFAGGGMAIGAGEDGGGGDDVPLIRNCIFYRNMAYWAGGGVAVRLDAAPNFINCLIVNNYADSGGGVYVEECTPNFELCTIADNYIAEGWYYSWLGVSTDEASPTFVNCILWGNPGGDSEDIDATNCLVDTEGISGDNMLYTDPMFTAGMYRAFWEDAGNYYVLPTSPTIDAGQGTLANPYTRNYGISTARVTTSSESIDRLTVDLGFHYPRYTGPDVDADLTIVIDGDPAAGRVEIAYMTDRFGAWSVPPPYDANNVYHLTLGDQLTLVAVPAPGFRVKQWTNTSDDGIFDLDYLYRDITMYAEDVEVRCEFEVDLPSTLNYPGQYSDLQYAINIARSGDTIIIHPGLYVLPGNGAYKPPRYAVNAYPCLTVSRKAITIRSVAPSDPCTVAGTIFEPGWGAFGIFSFQNCDRDTVVSGITIRNAVFYGASGLNGQTSNPRHPAGWDAGGVYGAGMRMFNASPTISNCVFQNCGVYAGNGGNGIVDNDLGYDGGHGGCAGGSAVFAYFGSPLLVNTTFTDCTAVAGNGGNGGSGDDRYGRGGSYKVWTSSFGGEGTRISRQGAGGAVFVVGGDAEFEDCTFERCYSSSGHSGTGSSPYEVTMDMSSAGGAVYVGGNFQLGTYTSSASFKRCTFTDNNPRLLKDPAYEYESSYIAYGGAVAADEYSNVTMIDCVLTGNRASIGGALYWASQGITQSTINIQGTTFQENGAFQGGAVYGYRGVASMLDNTFADNAADIESGGGSEPNQAGIGNILIQGGAMYLGSVDALIGDCVFTGNESTHSGGALAIAGNNQIGALPPRVHNCLFSDNTAGRDGGALVLTDSSEPNVANCSILYNAASGTGFDGKGSGGGLSVTAGSRATIENCLLWDNTAYNGSQMSLVDPNGGTANQNSYATIKNSMVQGGQSGIAATSGFLTYESSNIHTGTPGYVYDHITQADQFIDDYSLSNTSPCVDAGSIDLESPVSGRQPLLPLGRYVYTLRADSQRDTGIIDIGYHRRKAGEYPRGDINYSGTVDMLDLAAMMDYWLADWCKYPDWCEGADLSENGRVNLTDQAYLSQLYGAGDVTAPLPNPAQWFLIPTANSTTSITMTAVTGRDNSGNAVEYLFESMSAGGHSSSWQTSSTYTDSGLTTGLEYGYRVKVRDVIPDDPGRHNETAWSSTLYGYAGEDGRAPNPNPSEWTKPPYATSATSIAMTAATAIDASGAEYYFRCESGLRGYDSGWQASPSFINTGLEPSTQYSYTVRTRDKSAAKNTGGLSIVKLATTFSQPDTTPPTPKQAQWLTRPYAYWDTAAFMGAVLANDASGVEYSFECTRGGHEYDSGWQRSNFYDVVGLVPNTTYTFIVRVRDRSPLQNECTPSVAVTFTTLTVVSGIGVPPFPDPMGFSIDSAWGGAETGFPTQVIAYEGTGDLTLGVLGYYHVMTALPAFDWTGSSLGVEYYFDCITYPKISSGWINLQYDPALGSFYYARVGGVNWPKKYIWRVKARDIWNVETGWSPAYVAGGN